MKLINMDEHLKKALCNLKSLEGLSMTYEQFKETLFLLVGTSWAHSDEDYGNDDSDEGYFMIHSLHDIECEEPFVLPDGTQTHINGDTAWEIFFVNHDDRDSISLEDNITVDEVNINVPEHLFL